MLVYTSNVQNLRTRKEIIPYMLLFEEHSIRKDPQPIWGNINPNIEGVAPEIREEMRRGCQRSMTICFPVFMPPSVRATLLYHFMDEETEVTSSKFD